jgi:hypothetical protein
MTTLYHSGSRTGMFAAYFTDGILATMPLASAGYEAERIASGEVRIWLAAHVVNKLRAMRGPGESYSDVILRLATDGEPR